MKTIFLYLFLLIFQTGFTQNSIKKFPVVAWGSVPEIYTNDIQYNNLKNAGINFSFSHFTSLDNAIKALDIAAKYNVKILLYCPELFSETEKTVNRVKDHPGLGGYLLSDEPDVSRFNFILSLVKKIKSIDRKNICYINLYPIYASNKQLGNIGYQEYLNKFYSLFNLHIFSFDHYPITNGVIKKDWYQNLEIVSRMTKNKNASFWGFVKIVSIKNASEIINLSDLKLQLFTNLAYGAQGIQFYRYWSLPDKMYNGPISTSGLKNKNYYRLKELSQYIYNLQPVFLNCVVENIYHTESTVGASKFSNSALPFLRINKAKDLLISKIKNNDNLYVVFVNKSLVNKSNSIIYPGKDVTFFDKNFKGVNADKGKPFNLSIDPGEIMIMQY